MIYLKIFKKLQIPGKNTNDLELIFAPGVTRTHGTWIRNPLLYPPELRGQGF
jgi:hypothetical protein